MRARVTLMALIGHWRRHPVECLTLIAGLAVATALWSGVQALNAEARASYDRAAALLGGGTLPSIVAEDGGRFAREDFATLRLLGWPVTPVLEGRLSRGDDSLRTHRHRSGHASTFGGRPADRRRRHPADRLPVAAASRTGRSSDPRRLGMPADLPPLAASDALPPDVILVDIGLAERLLDAEGRISRLLLHPRQPVGPCRRRWRDG